MFSSDCGPRRSASQVCGFPSRTRSFILMNSIRAGALITEKAVRIESCGEVPHVDAYPVARQVRHQDAFV